MGIMRSEHSDRFVLQDLVFHGRVDGVEELFIRGSYAVDDSGLHISSGETVTFDTYYNSFHAAAWKEYSGIERFGLHVRVVGRGRLCIRALSASRDLQLIEVVDFDSREGAPCVAGIDDIDLLHVDGLVFFSIEAISDVVVLCGAYDCEQPPARDVSLMGCMCTYRREADVIANVSGLLSGTAEDELRMLVVVDNGRTLAMNEKMPKDQKRLKIIENPNYGGSAGYARGMIEALGSEPAFSHILLMDDDAITEAFVVKRLVALLRYLKDEYAMCSIGAARFSLEHPWIQETNMGKWTPGASMAYGVDRDMRNVESLIGNEVQDVNYIAWFFACIPVKTIEDHGLPLPFFFQHDDVEHSLRSGGPFITVNGLNVWHPSPKYAQRPFAGYYAARNDLILMDRHFPEVSRMQLACRLLRHSLSYVSNYRYEEAESYILGYVDYCRGPSAIAENDPERLNSDLMSRFSYARAEMSVDQLDELSALVESPKNVGRKRRLAARLINLLPLKKRARVYPYVSNWADLDLFAVSDIYFIRDGAAYHLSKSYARAFCLMKETFKTMGMVWRRSGVKNEWRDACRYYETTQYWRHLLTLGQ